MDVGYDLGMVDLMNNRCCSEKRDLGRCNSSIRSVPLGGLSLFSPRSERRYIVLGLEQLCGGNDSQAGTTGGTCRAGDGSEVHLGICQNWCDERDRRKMEYRQ